MCRFSNLAIVRFYRKILALGTSNQLPLPIIDYHRTTGYNRLHKAVINYQQALVVTRYACNRLQIIPNYIYLVFAEPSFLPSLWRCSSFLKLQIIISSSFLNQIASNKAQSSSFPILYKAHQLKSGETTSNGRIIQETKGILFHHHHCRPSPPWNLRRPTSTNSSFSFISLAIHLIFLRWSASEVLLSIL